jgi:hypothetical protein
MTNYTPYVFKLPLIELYNHKDTDVKIASSINQPLISLGFHSFIHRTKSAMDLTKKLETKNEFYYVVNPFEITINDYKDDIENITKNYFSSITVKQNHNFYIYWEILTMFNIANLQHMKVLGIDNGNSSFSSVINYREKFYSINKDKLYLEKDNDAENIPKKLINIIKNNDKVDLIIAECNIKWHNENYQEQEAYYTIFSEIIKSLKHQAKNGNLVLKYFETFTMVSIKMLSILSSFYEEVYIYKPYFSRLTNSEKYIICQNFKSTDIDIQIKYFEKILESMKTTQFVIDIFPKYILNKDLVNIFKYINITSINTQQIMINQLIIYIKSNNYFGDEYHNYRDSQIKATKWWLSTYFTEKQPYFVDLIKDTSQYNLSEISLFINSLI